MDPDNTDEIVEYRLYPGQRYGWWEEHSLESKKRDVVMVHGAVNDYRTKILLDTGATVSIVSLDLARKLGLKLRKHKQMKVSGMGGVPTYISASAQVKITLGPRVMYILDVWIANIGEGINMLLGVGFMYGAGIRISVREGLVTLPDEETIVMCGWSSQRRLGVDLPIHAQRYMYLRSGEDSVVRIQYGQANPQSTVVWAGRGEQWVTQIIYAAKSWPIAVRVVNVSTKILWIDDKMPLARIVEYGSFPQAGRFVRPGSPAYREWQSLIQEIVSSRDAKIRAKRMAEIREAFDSPYTSTNTPKYKWPTKLLTRPKDGSNRVQMVRLQPVSGTRRVRFTRDAATQTEDDPEEDIVLMRSVGVEASDLVDGSSDGIMEAVPCGENDPECTTSEVATDDENLDHGSKGINNLDASDSLNLPVAVMTGTPMDKLKKEYDRCMRVTVEDLDLEPAVYMREGSEILSQLRDQLALLPDLQDLSPECNIEEADVGDPVKSTPEMVDKLRRILKQHRKIFLGDGKLLLHLLAEWSVTWTSAMRNLLLSDRDPSRLT
ncbi:uncharacterized protein KRP23_11926 [Phytophthora ramorum]|uniref:uncharacterized protein n=1 Tax=Phytophthora ramorum TaxID=164328 RepID=UPI0030B7F21C|nr:hypothetical protein KRP23_11926 [Phytophthora ramorum]